MPSSQLKIGAVLGYAEILLTTLIGLVLTPFIINSLGNSEYGLYTLIGSLVGYLSLMDLGLNNAIIRFVSNFRSRGDKDGEEKFLGTTLLIYGIISTVVVLLGLCVYFNLESIFRNSLTAIELSRAKTMFLILVFNIAIVLPSNSFFAICSAYEEFIFSKGIRLLRIVLRTATVYAILTYGGKAISLVIIDTCYNVVLAFITYLFTRERLHIRYNFSQRRFRDVRPIFSYSVWILLLTVISQFQWQFGQILLGITTDTTAVAVLSVGVMLGTYYGAFSGVLSGLFTPMAARVVVAGEENSQRVFEKLGRYNFAILMVVLLGFLFFGQDFIALWLHDEVYKDAWLIALMIMVAYTIPLVQAFANSILEIKGYVKYKFVVYFTFLFLGFVGGYFLIPQYAGVGIMGGITVGWIAAQVAMNFFFVLKLHLNLVSFFKQILCSSWITIGGTIGVGLILNIYIDELSWRAFVLKVVLFLIVYVALAFCFFFSTEERKRFLKK
ncbi:MAG: oligosaccharide flippase family protein [bacterium]